MNNTPDDTWLSVEDIRRRYKLKRSATVQQWVREGKFPPPVKLMWKVSRWRLSDIRAWEEGKAA